MPAHEQAPEPLTIQELSQQFIVTDTTAARLSGLVFSLENALDCGDDSLAQQYEDDIAQIYQVNPGLR